MEDISVLIKRSQEGDKEAREVLIDKNLGLVKHIARRFLGRGVEPEDLFQIGTIGLMKAIDRFDLSLGLQFSTYAVPVIMGEIKRFLRDDGLVKVSRSVRENSARLSMVREELISRLGREPCLEELMEAAGMSREDAILALEADHVVESLEGRGEDREEGGSPLMDRIVGDPGGGSTCASICPGCEDVEKNRLLDHMLLGNLLDSLPGEERRLIYLRYFREKTQTQIAQELGISQVQVSRREKKILEKLRRQINS